MGHSSGPIDTQDERAATPDPAPAPREPGAVADDAAPLLRYAGAAAPPAVSQAAVASQSKASTEAKAAAEWPAPAPTAETSYFRVDLTADGFVADRERFYEPSYRPTLRRMAALVIEREGPIFEDCLMARIAAAHGFARAAGKIRATVTDAIETRFARTREGEGDESRMIYWPQGAASETPPPFRAAPRDVRDHADIPLIELAGLAACFLAEGAGDEEAVRRMAERFDLGRLHASTRSRFEDAVRIAREKTA